MQNDAHWPLIREVSSLELEFAQFRGIVAPVVSHPTVVESSECRTVVEVLLAGASRHAIKVEFDLQGGGEARPIVLYYECNDWEEIYDMPECWSGDSTAWFTARSDVEASAVDRSHALI